MPKLIATENITWPLVRTDKDPLTLNEIKDALNSLNERLSAIESAPVSNDNSGASFSAADRAMLTEVGAFFGIHAAVAEAIAGNEPQPNVVASRQTFEPPTPQGS